MRIIRVLWICPCLPVPLPHSSRMTCCSFCVGALEFQSWHIKFHSTLTPTNYKTRNKESSRFAFRFIIHSSTKCSRSLLFLFFWDCAYALSASFILCSICIFFVKSKHECFVTTPLPHQKHKKHKKKMKKKWKRKEKKKGNPVFAASGSYGCYRMVWNIVVIYCKGYEKRY